MEGLVLLIHIIVCVLLIVIVLLQSGKSADLAGAFGGGGSQSTFGPRGTATLLSKMTTTLAILFMITSLSLWILAANRAGSTSILSDDDVKKGQAATEQTTGEQTAGEQETTAAETGETTAPKDEAAPAADTGNKGTEDSGKQEGQKEQTQTNTDKSEGSGETK